MTGADCFTAVSASRRGWNVGQRRQNRVISLVKDFRLISNRETTFETPNMAFYKKEQIAKNASEILLIQISPLVWEF